MAPAETDAAATDGSQSAVRPVGRTGVGGAETAVWVMPPASRCGAPHTSPVRVNPTGRRVSYAAPSRPRTSSWSRPFVATALPPQQPSRPSSEVNRPPASVTIGTRAAMS